MVLSLAGAAKVAAVTRTAAATFVVERDDGLA